ncbi:hypothetical protein HYPSUDRAFT_51885 [Hypholoma sublateritium FD-334 SS-4]|uniref:Uncharacterized protein n=1 Tax=Hypholoma sublateritium (strain FD-334 SS-4) TaxID=945553 RepID=A0A0D2P8K9_HYPSF|nr:hypothetical protein HYPSUDRAFT_51885 [Hypholoma sublateritium FD-334 SS-4]
MATSESTFIPPQFSHLVNRPPSFWRPRRQSTRSSLLSNRPINEELSRLKEGINFWVLEHSKIHAVLTKCHTELTAAQQKILTLEHKTDLDTQIIMDLRRKLAQYPRPAETMNIGTVPSRQDTGTPIEPLTSVAVSSTETLSTVRPSKKAPTIKEYSNALHLTLATRKELRDQRKVTKFWKGRASLTVGEHDLITPSTSAISSIHERIPARRQAALETLIMRRGLASQLANTSLLGRVSSNIEAEQAPQFNVTLSEVHTLSSSCSKSSVGSRLAPLASESLKAEINSMLGSQGSSTLLSYLPRKSRGSSSASLVVSGSSKSMNTRHIIESTSNSSLGLERTFEVNNIMADHATLFDASFLRGLPSISSFLQISALPSGSSETFGEHLAASARSQNPTPHKAAADRTIFLSPSVKQASKECTSRRSWQQYTSTKFNIVNRPSAEVAEPQTKRRKPQSDKENIRLSLSLPVFQRRRSRLPVPIFGKK